MQKSYTITQPHTQPIYLEYGKDDEQHAEDEPVPPLLRLLHLAVGRAVVAEDEVDMEGLRSKKEEEERKGYASQKRVRAAQKQMSNPLDWHRTVVAAFFFRAESLLLLVIIVLTIIAVQVHEAKIKMMPNTLSTFPEVCTHMHAIRTISTSRRCVHLYF